MQGDALLANSAVSSSTVLASGLLDMVSGDIPVLVLPSVALNRPFVLHIAPAAGDESSAQFESVGATSSSLGLGADGGDLRGLSYDPSQPQPGGTQMSTQMRPHSAADAALAAIGLGGGRAKMAGKAAGEISRQGYRIGNVCLLTGYDTASELSEMLPVFRLPGTAQWVRGVVNLHGNVVPIFDLADLLQVEHVTDLKVGLRPMMLVLGHSESAAAVIIDGLPERRRFNDTQLVDMPVVPPVLQGYVRQAFLADSEIWLDFDHAQFFDDMTSRMM
jgi:twitching motility protein PilI